MFQIEQDYKEIKELTKKFSDEVVAPLSAQIDKEEKIPDSLKEKLNENGFMGIFIPEEFQGAGMDEVSYAILIEEISRSCASTGVYLSAHNSLAVWPILKFGTEVQKKKYLPQMSSGEKVGCFCLSEPGAGSDAGSLTSFAEDKGDYFELNGTKNFITNGPEADLAIVFAKTTKTLDHKGISAFIVNTKDPGFKIIKKEEKLGIRGSTTAQIAFDNVRIEKSDLLGTLGKGFSIALATLDGGRIGIAAQALGIAEGAFRYAKNYAVQRVQFGQKIADFQGIQFMLADMSTKIAAARNLVYDSAVRKQKGVNFSKQSSQAKLFASETANWVCNKAIQICGGIGYTRECPVERYFRDAKITEIYEGTSEVQRLVIAHQEMKDLNT